MHDSQLIVVRHGSYLRDEWSLPENERPLSEPGREEVGHVASIIQRQLRSGELVRIVSSPTVRAVQSADIIGRAVGVSPAVLLLLNESPNSMRDYEEKIRELATKLPPYSTTIAVTHIFQVMDIVAACGHPKPDEEQVRCGSGFLLAEGMCIPLR